VAQEEGEQIGSHAWMLIPALHTPKRS
jgi:hypothetical protein